jgi:tetratricopeptide (TPR) repeat protein
VAIKGSLKEASLADVSQLLALGAKTGCLSVTDRSRFGQIYFERGRVTFARIINRRDRLGDMLVRDGVVGHAELQEAIDEQARRPDRRIGQLLIERGTITRDQLEHYIRRQIEEAVFDLFTWSQGSFFFEADRRPEDADILVSINPESLLLEGARRVDEWGLIEQRIPTLDLIFALDGERAFAAGTEWTSEQERVLQLLDGTRTVQDIVDASGLAEFDVGKTIFGLIQAGLAHKVGQRRREGRPQAREAEVSEHRNLGIAFYRSGMLVDARREFTRALQLRPDDANSRFHLALVAMQSREHQEAVRRLRELGDSLGARPELLLSLGYALAQLDRAEEAELAVARAETAAPGAARTALLQAHIRLRARDIAGTRAALAEYVRRLGAAAPSAAYYHATALVAALRGRLEDAREVLGQGLALYADSAPLLSLAAAVAERQGDLEESSRLNRRAADADAALAQPQKSLGDAAYRQGMHDEALAHYRRATELDPELGDDVYTRLGNLHLKRGDREAALQCWRQALRLNPANVVVQKNLEVATHAG